MTTFCGDRHGVQCWSGVQAIACHLPKLLCSRAPPPRLSCSCPANQSPSPPSSHLLDAAATSYSFLASAACRFSALLAPALAEAELRLSLEARPQTPKERLSWLSQPPLPPLGAGVLLHCLRGHWPTEGSTFVSGAHLDPGGKGWATLTALLYVEGDNASFSSVDGEGANQRRSWRWICFEKCNGLRWHKILIIDKINKAIMSLFVDVLLPRTCWPRAMVPDSHGLCFPTISREVAGTSSLPSTPSHQCFSRNLRVCLTMAALLTPGSPTGSLSSLRLP